MPACNPVTRKNPFASVNATWCCPALPTNSTVAPICATPAESLTYPDIVPGATPAVAATHSEIANAKDASIRVITEPPCRGFGCQNPAARACFRGPANYQSYSTANRTEGAICCLETLSATFTVSL